MKQKIRRVLACTMMLLLFSSCAATQSESATQSDMADTSGEAMITFVDGAVVISGDGATVSETTVTITKGGTYTLSGTLEDGQIIIDAGNGDAVTLILNNVDLTCSYSAAISVLQAASVTISTATDTENTIADGNSDSRGEDDEIDAAIYSKDDLIFDGDGILSVTGNYDTAIHGKDSVTVSGGTYLLTSVGDTLKGKDSVTISGGELTIEAGADGIQSNNSEDSKCGNVTITGGMITIAAAGDGIKAESTLYVENATIILTTEEDGLHCAGSVELVSGTMTIDAQQDGIQAGDDIIVSGGVYDILTGDGAANAPEHTESMGFAGWFTTSASDSTASAKGMKADGNISLSGGTFQLDCLDDGFHCGNVLTVAEGVAITLATGDDGLHADNTLTIQGGTIDITTSYEGLEAVYVEIFGGEITLVASDDGINAAGGDSVDTDFGFMGFGSEGAAETLEDAEYYIYITGGTLTIDAGGDGVDSNGAMFVTGGEIYVSGPSDSSNGALDYTTTGQITGGIFVAAGASGMAMNFDSSSTQVSVLCTLSSYLSSGTVITLTDSTGNILVETTITTSFNSIVISSPEMTVGSTYTLTCGDESTEITVSSIITSVSASGAGNGYGGNMSNIGGGNMGNMGQGGMNSPGGR